MQLLEAKHQFLELIQGAFWVQKIVHIEIECLFLKVIIKNEVHFQKTRQICLCGPTL